MRTQQTTEGEGGDNTHPRAPTAYGYGGMERVGCTSTKCNPIGTVQSFGWWWCFLGRVSHCKYISIRPLDSMKLSSSSFILQRLGEQTDEIAQSRYDS